MERRGTPGRVVPWAARAQRAARALRVTQARRAARARRVPAAAAAAGRRGHDGQRGHDGRRRHDGWRGRGGHRRPRRQRGHDGQRGRRRRERRSVGRGGQGASGDGRRERGASWRRRRSWTRDRLRRTGRKRDRSGRWSGQQLPGQCLAHRRSRDRGTFRGHVRQERRPAGGRRSRSCLREHATTIQRLPTQGPRPGRLLPPHPRVGERSHGQPRAESSAVSHRQRSVLRQLPHADEPARLPRVRGDRVAQHDHLAGHPAADDRRPGLAAATGGRSGQPLLSSPRHRAHRRARPLRGRGLDLHRRVGPAHLRDLDGFGRERRTRAFTSRRCSSAAGRTPSSPATASRTRTRPSRTSPPC